MALKREKSVFVNYLSKHGLRMTGQREVILAEFLRMKGHQSAEEITVAVKKKDRSISQATVYRVMKVLAESGIAREVRLDDGVLRYERNVDREHHDHLTCERCGKTIDIVDDRIEELQAKMATDQGFTITRHILNIFGICRECRKE
jgi:Fur family transcriptional regulator, ferric uptake regulator